MNNLSELLYPQTKDESIKINKKVTVDSKNKIITASRNFTNQIRKNNKYLF